MPMDIYVKLGDIKGESVDKGHEEEIAVAAVQVGESNAGEVAARLGIDPHALLEANPQIKNPSQLNAGQEIYLPKHPTPRSESAAAEASTVQGKVLPKAPVGDPLNASLVKASLSSLSNQSKDAKIDGEINEIGSQKQDAEQRYEQAMDAAATEMALGSVAGTVSQTGGTTTVQDAPGHVAERSAIKR